MRNSDSPYLADLFAISMRWLALFGLTISLGIGGTLNPFIVGTLALPALWNGYVSALAIFNRRLPTHRLINVSLDAVFAIALFIAMGGLRSGIFWVALLPLFSGAIYYEARGSLLVAVLMSLFEAGYTFIVTGGQLQLLAISIASGFNIISGIGVAMLSSPLIGRLRSSYLSTVNQRKESERNLLHQERDRMRALFAMIETFSATLNYQTVLETVLDTAISGLGGRTGDIDGMVAAVLLFGDDNNLEINSSRGFISRDQTIQLPADQGVLSEIFKTGETRLVQNPGEDVELCKLMTLQKRSVALCMPLIRGMTAYGTLIFAHNNTSFFAQDRIETLQMFSNQAVIALQNARLYQDLAHEKERIVQTQEEAQKKLARDLHDGPTQSVSAIAMRLSIVRKMMEKTPKDAHLQAAMDEIARVEDLARRTTQEIRHMLFTLRPLVLETEGLVAALNTMADKMNDLYQQKVIIDADEGIVQLLDPSRQTVIFQITEEAVTNARKHARAPEVLVRIKFPPNEDCIVMLEIVDNGIGFNVKEVMGSYDRRGSLGMINLRERADLINGLLKIDSVQGKGTRVRVFIPLNDEAADRLHRSR